MPELPEVETVVRTLEHQLKRITIEDCHVYWDRIIANPSKEEFIEIIKHKEIIDYQRYGKYLIFDLGDYVWIAHLRMEGKFYIQNPEDTYDKHVHVIFNLSDGRQLRYHDTRKFGKMYLYKKQEDIHQYPCFKNIGLDVFDERLDENYLYHMLHLRKITLKQALLDQRVIAGIGNIYADEICFAMRMHPETKIYHLRKKDFTRLLCETRRIMKGAITSGGTTIRSYTSSLGVDGRFQLKLKVHMKKGEKCSVCGNEIKKITVATRGTYYCPTCQRKK